MYGDERIDYNYSANEFYEEDDGNIWIGTHTGGLMKYDQNLNLTAKHPFRFSDGTRFSGGRVKKILQDREGNMWIGVANPKPSVSIFNEETGIFNLIDTTGMHLAMRFPAAHLSDMIEDRQGNMWLGYYSGLLWIKRDAGEEYHVKTLKHEVLSSTAILDLYEDNNGNIWIASGMGLYSTKPEKSDSLIFYKFNCSGCDQYVKPLSIYQASNGKIWVGTNQGLFQMNEKNRHYQPVNENHGLIHNNGINAITEDSKGNLWLATDKGLVRFDPEQTELLSIKLYESIDGLPYEESVSAPLFKSTYGNSQFCTLIIPVSFII